MTRGLHSLMEGYVDGDSRAFKTLHDRLWATVRRQIRVIVRPATPIDHLVELTFLRAHQTRASFVSPRASDEVRDWAVLEWYTSIACEVAMSQLAGPVPANAEARVAIDLQMQHAG